MPLSEQTLDDFDPKLQHLLAEIKRCDDLRRSPSEVESAYEKVQSSQYRQNNDNRGMAAESNLLVDDEARKALEEVLQYVAWQMGGLPQIGIEKKYRKYINPLDVNLDEIIQVLSTKLPERYAKLGAEIITRIFKREILHTVAVSPCYGKLPRGSVEEGLSKRVLNGKSLISNSEYVANFNVNAFRKTRVHAGQEKFVMNKDGNSEHCIMYLEDSKIDINNDKITIDGEERDGSIYLRRESDLDNNLVYKVKINLRGVMLKKTRLIAPVGEIKSSHFEKCTVVAEKDLTMVGGEWIMGELDISGNCNLSAQFFFGTKITLNNLPKGTEIIFYGCDFSYATISDSDLMEIAKRCDEKCFFSEEQIKILEKDGIKSIKGKPLNSNKKSKGKLSIMIEASRERNKDIQTERRKRLGIATEPGKTMTIDHLDTGRGDIEKAPVLASLKRNAYNNETRRAEHIDERLFSPLTSSNKEVLLARIVFFQKLANLIGNKKNVSRAEVLQFIMDNGKCACTALMLNMDFLDLPEVCSLPSRVVIENWRGSGSKNLGSLLEIEPEGGGDQKSIGIVNFNNVLHTDAQLSAYRHWMDYSPLDSDYDGNNEENRINPSRMKNTYYTLLQGIKTEVDILCDNLIHYGAYLHTLVSKHGYQWPEVIEDIKTHQITNLFHPNLSTDKSSKVVTNDVNLPISGNRIIALTGPNRDAGKTTLMHAIAYALSQSYSGAPGPGKVLLAGNSLHDHILTIPNARVPRGSNGSDGHGSESGMQNRTRILKEFATRVQKLAAKEGESPTKVILCLDEIMMGVTDPEIQQIIELNYIDELMNIPGVEVTMLLISPDSTVIKNLKTRFGDRMEFFAPPPDGTPHKLVISEVAGKSLPDAVLKTANLERLAVKQDWMDL